MKCKGSDNSFNSWIDKKDSIHIYERVNIFLNHLNLPAEFKKLNLIFPIMQQKLI